jgi:2-haloacid dehalogenase
MGQLQVLVFDAYGTIFNVHSVVETAESLFPGHGQALSQLWRSKQLEYSWLRSLMHKHVDFNRVTQDALRYACGAMKLSYTDAALEALNESYRTLAPFADAASALEDLNPRHRLAILSNGAPDMLVAVVNHSGLASRFEAVISVEEVGVFKPDPRVYQRAVDRLGVAAGDIGFVSSNGWDAAGAKAFGFTVFWINRTGAPVERLGVQPDHVLASLTGIAPLLR